jgi:uracil-DNA glycosylase family 4
MGSLLTRPPDDLLALEARITACRRCPRLVAWRERVARERRAAFAGETYWGRPVPGFGDPAARVYVLGLAPAAHGGNRTGRVFTGDRSGDFLIAAMHRTGFANQPTSRTADDGLRLHGAWIGAAVRCAPPENRPTPQERENCRPWSELEAALLPELRVILCLGALAWDAALALRGGTVPRPKPRFGHGALLDDGVGLPLLGTFHPSQQNTFTGRLTPDMLDAVLLRARELAGRDEA